MEICRLAVLGCLAAVLLACPGPAASTTAASDTGDAAASSTTSTPPTSSTTATPTTTDTTADTTSGCPEFVGFKPDLPRDCDPFAQDCPEGQKCAAWADDGGTSWNATKCVPVQRDPDAPGDPCTATPFGLSGEDSCAKGVMCWEVDGQGHGTCVALCTGSARAPVCANACETCGVISQGVLNLCLPQCDPVANDCAFVGDICVPAAGDAGGFICVLDASNDPSVFDPCDAINRCGRGRFCGDPSDAVECDPQAAGCCLPFCNPNGPACPGAGEVCTPWPRPSTCHSVHACTLPN